MEQELRESLAEIAALLVLLHESYLKDAIGSRSIVVSLATFLYDAGLDSIVTIVDVEILRRKIMNDIRSQEKMDYEQFYSWLRQLAMFIFRDRNNGGRRALHSLLVKYILPLASNQERMTAPIPLELRVLSQSPSFNTITTYYDFLRLWFASLTINVSKLRISFSPRIIP